MRNSPHKEIMREAAACGRMKPRPLRNPYRRDKHGVEHDMNLPKGMSCGRCVHLSHCAKLFGAIAEDEKCDFSPSRFQQSR